jgi:hypothetical protein
MSFKLKEDIPLPFDEPENKLMIDEGKVLGVKLPRP